LLGLILKEKGIYHTMNMFEYDVGRKCLVAEGWCPAEAFDSVRMALRAGTVRFLQSLNLFHNLYYFRNLI
jgi:vacuolar-type H+-ATPase subunit I/STV1